MAPCSLSAADFCPRGTPSPPLGMRSCWSLAQSQGVPILGLAGVTAEVRWARHPCRKPFPGRSLSCGDGDQCPAPAGWDVAGVRAAEPCQPLSPHVWGVLVLPGWCLCVHPLPGACLRAVCHPVSAESSRSIPRQSMAPGQDRVSPGTCFPPQSKLSFEQSKKEVQRAAPPGPPAEGLPQSRQELEAEKQAALNKGMAPGQHSGSCPSGLLVPTGSSRRLAGTLPLVPGRGFSVGFWFASQWASSPPGPSLRRRRRWCPQPACQGGMAAAWPTGSAPG